MQRQNHQCKKHLKRTANTLKQVANTLKRVANTLKQVTNTLKRVANTFCEYIEASYEYIEASCEYIIKEFAFDKRLWSIFIIEFNIVREQNDMEVNILNIVDNYPFLKRKIWRNFKSKLQPVSYFCNTKE